MPTDTKHDPATNADLNKRKNELAGDSIRFTVEPGVDTFEDLELTEDHNLTGAELIVEGASTQDSLFFQIVHPVYGVVKQFIKNYGVTSVKYQRELDVGYPSKLTGGLKIRLLYKPDATLSTRAVTLNLSLHKILA